MNLTRPSIRGQGNLPGGRDIKTKGPGISKTQLGFEWESGESLISRNLEKFFLDMVSLVFDMN